MQTIKHVSWLWYDNDKKATLKEKIERGAQAFTQKLGVHANEVHVNPLQLAKEEEAPQIEGLTVVPDAYTLNNNFWYIYDTDNIRQIKYNYP